MNDESTNIARPAAGAANAMSLPAVVDRDAFEGELNRLRVRELIGPNGPLTLLEAFEGRRQLIAYYFMWSANRPAPEQCEGCTWVTTQVAGLSYLHSRDITYAVLCQPQRWGISGNDERLRTNGRPIAQWSRLEAGRSDDLTTG